jgi:hypothetical protein
MSDIDYSEAAINLRLRQVSQLRELCLSLGKATPIAPEPDRVRDAPAPAESSAEDDGRD